MFDKMKILNVVLSIVLIIASVVALICMGLENVVLFVFLSTFVSYVLLIVIGCNKYNFSY